MIIRPELQALRSDDTPQRQAQASLHGLVTQWRTSGAGAGMSTQTGDSSGTPTAMSTSPPGGAETRMSRRSDMGDGEEVISDQ